MKVRYRVRKKSLGLKGKRERGIERDNGTKLLVDADALLASHHSHEFLVVDLSVTIDISLTDHFVDLLVR